MGGGIIRTMVSVYSVFLPVMERVACLCGKGHPMSWKVRPGGLSVSRLFLEQLKSSVAFVSLFIFWRYIVSRTWFPVGEV